MAIVTIIKKSCNGIAAKIKEQRRIVAKVVNITPCQPIVHFDILRSLNPLATDQWYVVF